MLACIAVSTTEPQSSLLLKPARMSSRARAIPYFSAVSCTIRDQGLRLHPKFAFTTKVLIDNRRGHRVSGIPATCPAHNSILLSRARLNSGKANSPRTKAQFVDLFSLKIFFIAPSWMASSAVASERERERERERGGGRER